MPVSRSWIGAPEPSYPQLEVIPLAIRISDREFKAAIIDNVDPFQSSCAWRLARSRQLVRVQQPADSVGQRPAG
jgi:hypothetical protein